MSFGLRRSRFELKSDAEFELMREAGLVVARALEAVKNEVRSGIRTIDLDRIAEQVIRDSNATPSFLGYHGYPASICVSVNSEVVHGIPGDRILQDGDLVSIDCGAIVDGWHGDAAISVGVGELSPQTARLSEVTRDALWAGLKAVKPGNHLGDIGAAVEKSVRSASGGPYGIVIDYVGHGIGSSMHMPPNVPNVGIVGKGPLLEIGMALAIEPMITLGSPEVDVLADDWTVVTVDDSWAAHWEHTVTITSKGSIVTTSLDGTVVA